MANPRQHWFVQSCTTTSHRVGGWKNLEETLFSLPIIPGWCVRNPARAVYSSRLISYSVVSFPLTRDHVGAHQPVWIQPTKQSPRWDPHHQTCRKTVPTNMDPSTLHTSLGWAEKLEWFRASGHNSPGHCTSLGIVCCNPSPWANKSTWIADLFPPRTCILKPYWRLFILDPY